MGLFSFLKKRSSKATVKKSDGTEEEIEIRLDTATYNAGLKDTTTARAYAALKRDVVNEIIHCFYPNQDVDKKPVKPTKEQKAIREHLVNANEVTAYIDQDGAGNLGTGRVIVVHGETKKGKKEKDVVYFVPNINNEAGLDKNGKSFMAGERKEYDSFSEFFETTVKGTKGSYSFAVENGTPVLVRPNGENAHEFAKGTKLEKAVESGRMLLSDKSGRLSVVDMSQAEPKVLASEIPSGYEIIDLNSTDVLEFTAEGKPSKFVDIATGIEVEAPKGDITKAKELIKEEGLRIDVEGVDGKGGIVAELQKYVKTGPDNVQFYTPERRKGLIELLGKITQENYTYDVDNGRRVGKLVQKVFFSVMEEMGQKPVFKDGKHTFIQKGGMPQYQGGLFKKEEEEGKENDDPSVGSYHSVINQYFHVALDVMAPVNDEQRRMFEARRADAGAIIKSLDDVYGRGDPYAGAFEDEHDHEVGGDGADLGSI